MLCGRWARDVARGGVSVDKVTRDKGDWGWRDERTRQTKEGVWMRRRWGVDEERRVDLMDQHQCGVREYETWVETRSKG